MFRPLEAIIRSRFGYPGGGIKFKVANGTGRGPWRVEISFFQMYYMGKGKGKVVPLQAWSDPDGSRTLSFPDFITAHNGRKVVRLKHRPPLVSENTSGTYFCYRLSRPRAIVRPE